jgi:hypothetical protein
MKLFIAILGAAGLSGCMAYGGGVYHGGSPYYDGAYYDSTPVYIYGSGGYTRGYRGGRHRDQDGDGISNRYDRDRDGDGIANRYDRDRDGDGIPNRRDSHPRDPRRR